MFVRYAKSVMDNNGVHVVDHLHDDLEVKNMVSID